MIDRTANQISELLERQDAHEQRLRVLMLQAAQHGIDTPPQITIEIKEIQNEVMQIAAQITKLLISSSKVDIWQHKAAHTDGLADVSLQLSSSTEGIRRIQQTMFVALIRWFDDDRDIRERRQRITSAFYVAVLVLLVIDILIRVYR